MHGLPLLPLNRFSLSIIAMVAVGLPNLGNAVEPDAKPATVRQSKEVVDPFVSQEKAAQALTGVWEYSVDQTLKAEPVYPAPQVFGPNGESAFPIEKQGAQSIEKEKPRQTVERKVTQQFRLDMRQKNRFRMEFAMLDHNSKTCAYHFAEGTWRLRGRLLVMTFLLPDEIDRWAIFVEELAGNEMVIRGIGEAEELVVDGRGTLVRKDKTTSLTFPKDYAMEVDESSFGPIVADLAEYLQDQLNVTIEQANESENKNRY